MNIDKYLEFRSKLQTIVHPDSVYNCWGWGLELIDLVKAENGLGVEFAPNCLPILEDYKAMGAKLLKDRLLLEVGGDVSKAISWANEKLLSTDDEALAQKMSALIELKARSFLSSPPPKYRPVFGVHYGIDDIVNAIEAVLEKDC